MPRQKKDSLSPAVGTVNTGRKSGNPDFTSSSFYCPKKVNLRFNSAINTLKAYGFDVDRSDILTVLMDRFSSQVADAEKEGDGEELNFEEILSGVTEASVVATAGLTYLKEQLLREREQQVRLMAELEMTSDQQSQATDEMVKQSANLVESMLKFVPDDQRAVYESALALMREQSDDSASQAD